MYVISKIIIPLLQVCWTTSAIVQGGVYFKEFQSFSTTQIICFALGVFIVFVGVFILSLQPPGDEDVYEIGRSSTSTALAPCPIALHSPPQEHGVQDTAIEKTSDPIRKFSFEEDEEKALVTVSHRRRSQVHNMSFNIMAERRESKNLGLRVAGVGVRSIPGVVTPAGATRSSALFPPNPTTSFVFVFNNNQMPDANPIKASSANNLQVRDLSSCNGDGYLQAAMKCGAEAALSTRSSADSAVMASSLHPVR